MAGMNEEALQRYLAGKSSDAEVELCEQALSDPETVVDCGSTTADDSLLAALQAPLEDTAHDAAAVESLAARMEQLVPRRSIPVAELQRLLEPAAHAGDLGAIGRYRVIELLASGGMGLVFRAIDSQLDRPACIKLLDPSYQLNADAVTRFERESREMARFNSERIVSVIEIGRCNDLPWFAMPLLSGTSLRTRIKSGSIDSKSALRYARQIAEGLRYAHGRGLLHRDIKPDNIWITETDDVKVLDFGLARPADGSAPLSHAGTLIGTPSYMSPEQVTGKPLDARSDLFSLGAVLIEMLTGAPHSNDKMSSPR